MREVTLKIKGIHNQDPTDSDSVEVISKGQYYEEDGYACIDYEEAVDENETGVVDVMKNTIKVSDEQVEIIKSGQSKTHMIFIEGKATYTYYSTPFGEIEVGINTKNIEWLKNTTGFRLDLKYQLEMNQQFVSDCRVYVEVEY